VLFHQVGDDLAVDVGVEQVAAADEFGSELVGVVDDAVVHRRHLARAVPVRMGVGLGHAPVGGPARVADADPQVLWRTGGGDPVVQRAHPSDRPDDEQLVLPDAGRRYPGRVISPVLQSTEGSRQEVDRSSSASTSDDSTHKGLQIG